MKYKYILCALLTVTVLLSSAGCSLFHSNTPVTPVATTAPPVTSAYTDQTTEPVTLDPDADPVLPPLEFDAKAAVYLGKIETGIYGYVKIYYQD